MRGLSLTPPWPFAILDWRRLRALRSVAEDALARQGGCATPYSPEPFGSCFVCQSRAVLDAEPGE